MSASDLGWDLRASVVDRRLQQVVGVPEAAEPYRVGKWQPSFGAGPSAAGDRRRHPILSEVCTESSVDVHVVPTVGVQHVPTQRSFGGKSAIERDAAGRRVGGRVQQEHAVQP
jgi:hypothetical protein